MLQPMFSGWELWLFLVGLAIGIAVTGVTLVRLPRADDDIGPDERPAEAAWIAGTIERYGGVAPVSFVEEVLELHQAYRTARRPPFTPSVPAPPVPPPRPPAPLGYVPPPPGPPPAAPRGAPAPPPVAPRSAPPPPPPPR